MWWFQPASILCNVKHIADAGFSTLKTPSSVSAETAMLFVHRIVAGDVRHLAGFLALDHFATDEVRNDFVGLVIFVGGFLAWPGNDERSTGFIDQDGVNFIDDGEVVAALARS